MLPNLSGLRLGGPPVEDIAGRVEREQQLKAEREKRAALVRQQQQAEKERRLQLARRVMPQAETPVGGLAGVLNRGGRFRVHVPRPGKEDWSATFTVEVGQETTIRMYRTGEPDSMEVDEDEDELEYCTGLKLEFSKDSPPSPSLYVETLFEVSDRLIGTCDMDPKGAPGVGNLTLQVYDLVASAMGVKSLTLGDMAMYRADAPRPPITLDSRLTSTLDLLRGYGYYGARGYFSADFVISDPTIGFERELAQIVTVSLTWTHTIATTPLKSLAAAVAAFPDAMNSLSFTVPKYCRDTYTRAWCTAHAELVRAKTVQPLFDWFKATYDETIASSYMSYSMRALTDVMNTGTELFRNQFGSALVAPFYHAINSNAELRKYVVHGRYLTVQANPGGRDLVPRLQWVDVRSDVRVELGV